LQEIESLLLKIIEDTLRDFPDIFLVEFLVRGKEERYVIDVFLDGDNGIDVEKCAKISRRIARILEEKDLFPNAYILNVSSPGVSKPLRFPRQYAQHIGRDVVVTLVREGANREVSGKLIEATTNYITLQPLKTEAISFQFHEVAFSKVKLPW